MNKTFLYLIVSTLLLAGCNQDDKVKGNSSAQVHASNSSFVGKPHAPISMKYELLNQAVLHETLEIRLIFSLQRDADVLKVSYKTDAQLKPLDAIQQFDFTNLEKGSEQALTIRVLPETSTLAYVNIFASVSLNGKQQARAFAVPVKLSLPAGIISKGDSKSTKSNGQMRYQPDHNVISMPAIESSNTSQPAQ